uniref:Uncharacterized protein n=1 Tax=Heterorhabditis bacteriophora TaxID=37862 RepID=A0A1I7WQZ6_HETBA
MTNGNNLSNLIHLSCLHPLLCYLIIYLSYILSYNRSLKKLYHTFLDMYKFRIFKIFRFGQNLINSQSFNKKVGKSHHGSFSLI